MHVVPVEEAEARSRLCESILRTLPDWFGIDEAIEAYVRDVAALPTFAVGKEGFVSVKMHAPHAAEVYVMGVRPECHGQGMGTALLAAAETYLRDRRVEFLQVKTLGPSYPDDGYARTRAFYEARGFVPLEEIHGVWEGNPCLVLVKRLGGERAPDAVLWDFLRGALMTKALGLVADLGIADALADGPRPVAELASDVGVDEDALHRVLRALASDGVFVEEEPGLFGSTETSTLLLRPGPKAFAHLFGDVFYRAAAELDRAVRTGSATFPEAFGQEFWLWLGDHVQERDAFDSAMAGGKEWKAKRLSKVEWHPGETVVDVGGGNGALLLEVLRDKPDVHGIVFDLPETVRDESAFGENIEFIAGTFFEQVPPGDSYVLSAILHDWDDERASAILRTIRASARPGARVFVAEAVIAPGNEPNGSKWLDLLMLVLAGGRERTEREWRALLEGAGFEPVTIEDGLLQARCR